MIDPLFKEDNFKKTESIKSEFIFGTLVSKPSITIAVPVYGFNPYLEQSLDSIVNQNKNNFNVQIIVCDDKEYSSTEENQVLSFLKKKRISNLAYYHTGGGLSVYDNFNRAIFLANTEYVVMNHDDDLLVKDYLSNLEKEMPFLVSHSNIGMVASKCFLFNSEPPCNHNHKAKMFQIRKATVTFFGTTLTGTPSCGFLVKKQLFIESGGFNSSFIVSADAFPAGIMILNKIKVYRFADITGYYRIANNSSLKLYSCRKMIEEDYLFYQSWKTRGSFLRKLYMDFFENYIYSQRIDNKIRMFSKTNPAITIQALDYRKKYIKYKKFGPHNVIHLVNYCFFGFFSKILSKRFK